MIVAVLVVDVVVVLDVLVLGSEEADWTFVPEDGKVDEVLSPPAQEVP